MIQKINQIKHLFIYISFMNNIEISIKGRKIVKNFFFFFFGFFLILLLSCSLTSLIQREPTVQKNFFFFKRRKRKGKGTIKKVSFHFSSSQFSFNNYSPLPPSRSKSKCSIFFFIYMSCAHTYIST